MDTWFDEQPKHVRKGSRTGSLLGEVSHLNLKQCRSVNSNLDKLWEAGAWAVCRLFRAEARMELRSQKSLISTPSRQRFCLKAVQPPGRQPELFAWVCVFIALGTFCSHQFAESTLPLKEAKSIVSFSQTFLLSPPGNFSVGVADKTAPC